METVVIIIMCLTGLVFLLKLTCHGNAEVFVLSFLAAASVILMTDFASSQSRTRIEAWLGQPDIMLDTSVWLTLDVAFQIWFCFLAANRLSGPLTKKELIAYNAALWIPGLMIFPVLSAALTELIFSLPGVDFSLVGWSAGLGLFVALPALARGLRALLPETDLRLEVMFLVSLIVLSLGIVATVNGRTAATGTNRVEWTALLAVICLLTGCAAAGFMLRKYKNRSLSKRSKSSRNHTRNVKLQ